MKWWFGISIHYMERKWGRSIVVQCTGQEFLLQRRDVFLTDFSSVFLSQNRKSLKLQEKRQRASQRKESSQHKDASLFLLKIHLLSQVVRIKKNDKNNSTWTEQKIRPGCCSLNSSQIQRRDMGNDSICARSRDARNSSWPFLFPLREIQMTVALTLAAKRIGWKQGDIWGTSDMLFFSKRECPWQLFQLLGFLQHCAAMAIKEKLRTNPYQAFYLHNLGI